jgi:hypothetical protein
MLSIQNGEDKKTNQLIKRRIGDDKLKNLGIWNSSDPDPSIHITQIILQYCKNRVRKIKVEPDPKGRILPKPGKYRSDPQHW